MHFYRDPPLPRGQDQAGLLRETTISTSRQHPKKEAITIFSIREMFPTRVRIY